LADQKRWRCASAELFEQSGKLIVPRERGGRDAHGEQACRRGRAPGRPGPRVRDVTQLVSDPREVVGSGDVVRVKVLGVDATRKRISLTLRPDEEPSGQARASPDAGQAAPQGSRCTGHRRRHGRRAAPRRAGWRLPGKVLNDTH
jgi:hypothetical protein